LDQDIFLHRLGEIQIRLDAMETILHTLLNQLKHLSDEVDEITHKLG